VDPALILILADEATLAGVVGADGSPVHPLPVPPEARQPPNHYIMNAIIDWIKDRGCYCFNSHAHARFECSEYTNAREHNHFPPAKINGGVKLVARDQFLHRC
jgi:hypothetical protein